MQHLSTARLIITLVIAVHQGSGVTAHERKVDQVAVEAKNRAVTIIGGPKYVEVKPKQPTSNSTTVPTVKPFKPSITGIPGQHHYIAPALHYYRHIQKIQPRSHYNKQRLKSPYAPSSIYKYPRVIPLIPHLKHHYYNTRQLAFAASTNKVSIAKSPKFSLPVQTINGIRTNVVRPPTGSIPFALNTTTTSSTTTTEVITTTKVLRTKRIWPTKELSTTPFPTTSTTQTSQSTTKLNLNDTISDTSERTRARIVRNVTTTTTEQPSTSRTYRPVTRTPKIKSTTVSMKPINFTKIEYNDWVPITPSHFPQLRRLPAKPVIKRSDYVNVKPQVPANKQMLYWHTYGLIPVTQPSTPGIMRKKMVFFNRKRQFNPHYSGYRRTPLQYIYEDQETEGSQNPPKFITKIKHHHHHHHHKYIKTVEKPVKVPYKVEVPRPYPVTVEKKVPVPVEKIKIVEKRVPYPVTVEKKVPYPVEIKVPHPVPYKVVEREYVPKPYPIVHHVPFIKHVQVKVPQPVPVTVEKKVPYPVQVKVPVDRPVPIHIAIEKRVPYPVPVKVLVPQPYPVETKVPYPVEVKQPFEVIKHVPVKVPYPQPYPVKVPQPVPVPVEKKVPYPIEVEKKVPVPVQVYVPHKVEVEKKVPVYVPKPYPVEKPVPVAVKVPVPYQVPVQVPVKIPVEVPVFIHQPFVVDEEDYDHYPSGALSVSDHNVTHQPLEHTVTVHGNRDIRFESRSDTPEATTAATSNT